MSYCGLSGGEDDYAQGFLVLQSWVGGGAAFLDGGFEALKSPKPAPSESPLLWNDPFLSLCLGPG